MMDVMLKYIIGGMVVLIVASIVTYLQFFRTPQKEEEGASTNLRIAALETAVVDLVKQVNSLGGASDSASLVSPTFEQTSSNLTLENRVKNMEISLVDLKARLTRLEEDTTTPAASTAPTTTTTTTSKSPAYIPIGTSGSSVSTNWTEISSLEVTIDPADYSGYKSMVLEIQLKIFQNGTAYGRLYNKTDGTSPVGSEVSTSNTDYTSLTSGSFTIPSGKKTYRIQLKSLTGYEAFAQNARIKVNF